MDNLALRAELPYLRRYARAITGNQRAGDSVVRVLLETILDNPESLNSTHSLKSGLFQLLHHIWPAPLAGDEMNFRPTALLDLRARQALFLTSVEGFSSIEVAFILGVPQIIIEQEIEQAKLLIEEQLHADILVIEDEAIVAMHIRSLIEEAGHKCVGIARTLDEAVRLDKTLMPELILADIRLADGSSGIDAVSQILETHNLPVIFVTAYPERLLTGERPEPTYLVTKPFEPDALLATISQALMFFKEDPELVTEIATAPHASLH